MTEWKRDHFKYMADRSKMTVAGETWMQEKRGFFQSNGQRQIYRHNRVIKDHLVKEQIGNRHT